MQNSNVEKFTKDTKYIYIFIVIFEEGNKIFII